VVWLKNIVNVYALQKMEEAGQHIKTFREDLHSYINEKFHITLLTLPVLGIVIFTVIPILLLILVAFTNYDQQHMPPNDLFTWTGLKNFISLFGGGGLTVTFGYAFVRVLGWTLVWAFFATFTTYIGGILLSLLLNNKKTRLPKLWRTLFIVTIAVPQFVSLLLVRNFFSNGGIVNTICANIGLTGFLRNIGLISTSYIPFLSAPGWAHVMIILINIWIGVPYQMLIATGVLMNLPSDQLESARVDGASPFQMFRNITMPYLLFVTGPALVTDFVKNINNFNVIYLLTQDVYTTTNQAMANSQAKEVDLLVTWLFRLTQDYYNYKMASVIGIVVFVICAVFTLIAFNWLIRGDREGTYQ
jgi:arabinogalactan oligomer/maltooligosaccharide transport system permease protein